MVRLTISRHHLTFIFPLAKMDLYPLASRMADDTKQLHQLICHLYLLYWTISSYLFFFFNFPIILSANITAQSVACLHVFPMVFFCLVRILFLIYSNLHCGSDMISKTSAEPQIQKIFLVSSSTRSYILCRFMAYFDLIFI